MAEFKVGLQLYSIRDEMEKDMDASLKKVKEMGYDYVEFAGYFGHSAQEVRDMLDKYELSCISVHQSPDIFISEGQAAVDFLKTIGATYCAIPWYEIDKLKNHWDETISMFTKVGKLLKENGIQMLYHNHDFEFTKVDGEYILDRLYKTIPADLLQPQIDTCWVHYAGCNPAEYLRKYSGRIQLVHLKDFACKKLGGGPVYALIGEDGGEAVGASKEDNGFEFRPVGYGIQDFPAILQASKEAGAEYVIVEQDNPQERTSMEAAKLSRDYLKTLGI